MSSDSDSNESDYAIPKTDLDGESYPPVLPSPVQLPEPLVAKTSKLFTKGQRRYLNSLKAEYVLCPKVMRAELCVRAAEHMLERMEQRGKATSAGEKSAFRANVRRWFQQNCRASRDLPQWSVQWTGRLVYYHKNKGVVTAEWIRIRRKNGEVVPEADEGDVDPLSEDEDGEDPEEEGNEGVKTEPVGGSIPDGPEAEAETKASRRPPPVKFFQQALTNLYSALPSPIRAFYEKTAVEWRMNGPDDETKKKLADKDLPRISRHFAETVYRQMNVRVAMFVTYVGESGGTVVSFMDYTSDFGNRSFSTDFGSEFQSSGVMGYWGAYGRAEFGDAVNASHPKSDHIRKRGKPLLDLRLNAFGEPIIPDPADVPAGEQANEYLKRLIRNIVIYTYARACRRDPKSVGPPWARMAQEIRSFVRPDYLPDELAIHFKEPTGIKVKPAREILGLWYRRQSEGLIPLDIHNVLDEEGNLVPRIPRERLDTADDDPDFVDEGVVLSPPIGTAPLKSRQKSVPAKKKQKTQPKPLAPEVAPAIPSVDGESSHGKSDELSKKRKPKLRIRLVVNSSDSDSVAVDLNKTRSPAIPLSPSLSPVPTTATSSPGFTPPPEAPIDGLNSDPAIAGLDESLRDLILGAVRRHLNPTTHPQPVAPSVIPTALPTPQSPSLAPRQPLAPAGASGSLLPPIQGDPLPSARSTTRRTRKTEEQSLLEAAVKAGAKSGTRTRRKTERGT
ncbi:hypothetical protein MD484_g8770, partial [Candolleomyces efflorescens]